MRINLYLAVFLLLAFPVLSHAQDSTVVAPPDTASLSGVYAESDLFSLEDSFDSISLFLLLDSLIQASEATSELVFRSGYKSNLTVAGRDYSADLAGITAGASYYHYSGFYTDLYSNWNTNSDPSYYLTAMSAGYLGLIGKAFSYSGSYTLYSYNNGLDFSAGNYYPHDLSASASLQLGKLIFGTDYSLLFGDSHVHRLSGSVTGYFKFKNVGFLDYIAILPNASVLYGNQSITTLALEEATIRRIVREFGLRALRQYVQNVNVYGIMNYYLSLPVTVKKGRFRASAAFNYNIPVALPGELYELNNTYYTSINLYYSIPFQHYLH